MYLAATGSDPLLLVRPVHTLVAVRTHSPGCFAWKELVKSRNRPRLPADKDAKPWPPGYEAGTPRSLKRRSDGVVF